MSNLENLQVTTPSDCEVAVTRVFDAPRRLVYDVFTKPELMKRWLSGPHGWSMTVCEIELRVGGAFRHVWSGPEGRQMSMHGVHREIVRSSASSAPRSSISDAIHRQSSWALSP